MTAPSAYPGSGGAKLGGGVSAIASTATATRTDVTASSPSTLYNLNMYSVVGTGQSVRDLPYDFVGSPLPGGVGVDDVLMWADIGLWASSRGKAGMKLPAGSFRVQSLLDWPDGLAFIGSSIGRTLMGYQANGCLQFGVLDGSGARSYPEVSGFTINGNGLAIKPIAIGHITASRFRSFRVAGAAGTGVYVATSQNSLFEGIECAQNAGDNFVFDLGAANNTLVGCILRASSGGSGLVFDQSADTPPNTAASNNPRNIHVFGGLIEGNALAAVRVASGGQLDFLGAQTAGAGGSSSPTFWMDNTRPTRTLSKINFISGQINSPGAPGVGTCVQVERGEFSVDGGTTINNGLTAFAIADGALVDIGDISLTATTNELLALGAGPARNLVRRFMKRTTAKAVGNSTYNNNVTLADIPGLFVDINEPGDYHVTAYIAASGDSTADLKLGWTGPGTWSMSWTPDSILTNATGTATGGVSRQAFAIGGQAAIGEVAGTGISKLEGFLTADVTGRLQLQGAQNVATVADVVISAVSRLWVEKV